MQKKRNKLIIFDLFGTIIETPSKKEVEDLLNKIEKSTNSKKGLYSRWLETSEKRDRGEYKNYKIYWESIGVKDYNKANKIYLEKNKKWLDSFRCNVDEMLAKLDSLGYDLALCSNAGFETYNIIKNNSNFRYFKKLIISAEVKYLKPAKEIYILAVGKKRYEKVYFVGDGGSSELTGAEKIGLIPVQIAEYINGKEKFRKIAINCKKIKNLSELERFFINESNKK